MQNNFVLEESKRLNNRLNVFTDTYLLKLNTNVEDPGDPEDDKQRNEEVEIGEEVDTNGYQEDGTVEIDSDNDHDLQRALMASMQTVPDDLTDSDTISYVNMHDQQTSS